MAARAVAEGGDLEVLELAIRTTVTSLGASLLEGLLAADDGYRGPRAACTAGHQAVFTGYRAKTIDTVIGPVTLRRAWYHCATCRHGLAPRDAELGCAQASISPGLARMTARAAAAVPFARAAGLLGELAGIELTVKRVERSAEAAGAAAAATISAETDAICARQLIPVPPPAPAPDMLYIAIDGTGVPMVPAATRDRAGKTADGKARTREVKLACLFTQTTLDEDGFPGPRPGLVQLPGQLRPGPAVRPAGGRRGPPPRQRAHPPARRARRRRRMDLEPCR